MSRSFLVVTVVFVVLALLGDARPAWTRAPRRVAVTQRTPRGRRDQLALVRRRSACPGRRAGTGSVTRAHARRGGAVAHRPGSARRRRARPPTGDPLAEGDGSIEELAVGLRETLDEVEALSAAQHAIQLEVGGLRPGARVARRAGRDPHRAGGDAGRRGCRRRAGRHDAGRAADRGRGWRIPGRRARPRERRPARPGCTVAIRVRAGPARAGLSIADDGPGITPRGRAPPSLPVAAASPTWSPRAPRCGAGRRRCASGSAGHDRPLRLVGRLTRGLREDPQARRGALRGFRAPPAGSMLAVSGGATAGPGDPAAHRPEVFDARTRYTTHSRRDEAGQGLAEYALILALVAIVAIVALIFLGDQIATIFRRSALDLSPTAGASGGVPTASRLDRVVDRFLERPCPVRASSTVGERSVGPARTPAARLGRRRGTRLADRLSSGGATARSRPPRTSRPGRRS